MTSVLEEYDGLSRAARDDYRPPYCVVPLITIPRMSINICDVKKRAHKICLYFIFCLLQRTNIENVDQFQFISTRSRLF